MDRAARCCLAWLNPKAEFLPTGGYEVAHDTGRWWDAMLRYEHATCVPIPAETEAAMVRNLRALTDNPAALLMNTPQTPGSPEKVRVNPHNLRESMLAYGALVRHRGSDWAQAQGHRLLETIRDLLQPDGQLDYAGLAEKARGPLTADPLMVQRAPAGEWFNATATTGRALEAIVWFHEATGDPLASELAQRLAKVHFAQTLDPSGAIRPELLDRTHVGHTHSYCGTLRGLLLYGLANREQRYIDAVNATYRRGLWGSAISRSGWTPHDQGKLRFTGKEGDPLGEHASCGDVAQMALWLAFRAGQTDLLDDVERLIRARLLPSQIAGDPDPRRDGAWGVYADPFGRGAILDVFAAVLHSTADFQENAITASPAAVSINLHFSTETAAAKVTMWRDESAHLAIEVKRPVELRIRVPGWADRERIQLSQSGQPLPLQWDGAYLALTAASIDQPIELQYALPRAERVEEMPVSHRKFHLTWRGDVVTGCAPTVPIYPEAE